MCRGRSLCCPVLQAGSSRDGPRSGGHDSSSTPPAGCCPPSRSRLTSFVRSLVRFLPFASSILLPQLFACLPCPVASSLIPSVVCSVPSRRFYLARRIAPRPPIVAGRQQDHKKRARKKSKKTHLVLHGIIAASGGHILRHDGRVCT